MTRWTHICNTERPHSALGYQPTAVFAAQLTAMGDQRRASEPLCRSPIAPSAQPRHLQQRTPGADGCASRRTAPGATHPGRTVFQNILEPLICRGFYRVCDRSLVMVQANWRWFRNRPARGILLACSGTGYFGAPVQGETCRGLMGEVVRAVVVHLGRDQSLAWAEGRNMGSSRTWSVEASHVEQMNGAGQSEPATGLPDAMSCHSALAPTQSFRMAFGAGLSPSSGKGSPRSFVHHHILSAFSRPASDTDIGE